MAAVLLSPRHLSSVKLRADDTDAPRQRDPRAACVQVDEILALSVDYAFAATLREDTVRRFFASARFAIFVSIHSVSGAAT